MDDNLIQLLTLGNSPHAQTHILTYFEQFKKQSEGWQVCGDILARNLHEDERVKFFCLQVLETHLTDSYPTLEKKQQHDFKICLQQWYKQSCAISQKNSVRNKSAQLFCLLFVQEYPRQWPTFFNELLSLLDEGPLAVDNYLRVLVAIDEEVVARCIPHTQQEFQRNTDIKDHMRDHCVKKLVESWYQILKLYEQKDNDIVCLCLKVIGAYIAWIDISLIANDSFISCLLTYLSFEDIRESACECLLEITNKGMNATGKTALVESLFDVLTKTGILEVNVTDDNVDFLIKLSSLLNGMGIQLITSLSKLTTEESEDGLKLRILQAIDTKIPHMLRFLGDDDDDISEAVFEFCHSYLALLKQLNGPGVENCRKYIKDLLNVIIKKLKYDDDFDFENESDNEVEFLDFRKQMKVLLNNLAKLDGDNVLMAIFEMFKSAMNNCQNLEFKDVEVAIHVLYCLGEAYPGQMLYTDATKSELFQNMMSLLITSNVSQHQHSTVKLQYFETVTRYERFFYAQTQHIPTVLISFLDERGLRNKNKSICSRTSFLFMRFVKTLKNQVQPYVDDILKRLQGLLVNGENGYHANLSENDRYYLYEVAAVLITCSSNTPEKQLQMMETLFLPIMNTFQKTVDQITSTQLDELQSQQLAFQLHHLMSYTSRASKAFATAQSLKVSGCTPCFKEALTLFLHALNIPVHRDIIHSAVRQYIHRMIICLHDDLLTYVPLIVTRLLKDCEMRDVQEFIPLINQLTTRFKSAIAPFLSEICMPLVTQIFTFLQAPIEPNDQEALKEKQLLQRSYFLFIATIANTNILQVLSNQDASSMKDILMSVVHGAVEIPDPQGQKTCFVIFNKLVEYWGSDEAFKDFIYESIVPSCFLAPMKDTFDMEDAQTTFVIHEIANTLKKTLEKRGLELIQWLEHSYLPQNNCPPNVITEYVNALQTTSLKAFKNFLKMFYMQAKS